MEKYHSREHQTAQELIFQLQQPRPTVIAIEGGPCSGKTTLVQRLAEAETDRQVVVLPEAATAAIDRLAKQGWSVPELAAADRPGFLAFEAEVLGNIIDNIEQAKRQWAGSDAIIVTDRCDIGAYIASSEYEQILTQLERKYPPMLELVDHLYYLPSVALESPDIYDELKSSNVARYESRNEAQATCRANLAAVARHPELHVAWGGDFTDKLTSLVEDITHPEQETELALECTDPSGIIRRIKRAHESGRYLSQARIEQSYHQLDGWEFRLRKTTTDRNEALHAFTIKSGDGLQRRELQRQIDEADYQLLRQTPQLGRVLHKNRYEFLEPHPLTERGLRKWTADYYDEPHLRRWQVEIDLRDTSPDELLAWSHYLTGNQTARPTTVRARDLADV